MLFPNGPKLRQEILRAGLSESKVATRLKVSKSTLSRWCSGEVEPADDAQKSIVKMFPAVTTPWRREQAPAFAPTDSPKPAMVTKPKSPIQPPRSCPERERRLTIAALTWIAQVSPELLGAFKAYLMDVDIEGLIAMNACELVADWAERIVTPDDPLHVPVPHFNLTPGAARTIEAELHCWVDRLGDYEDLPQPNESIPAAELEQSSGQRLSFIRYMREDLSRDDPPGFDDSKDPRLKEYDRKRATTGAA